MFLREITVRGYRAAATSELRCSLPGRFGVLVGPNNSGKTTLLDAAYLAHPHRFPAIPRPTAASLGPHPRSIDIGYSFDPDPAAEGPLGKALQGEAGDPRRARSCEVAGRTAFWGEDRSWCGQQAEAWREER